MSAGRLIVAQSSSIRHGCNNGHRAAAGRIEAIAEAAGYGRIQNRLPAKCRLVAAVIGGGVISIAEGWLQAMHLQSAAGGNAEAWLSG